MRTFVACFVLAAAVATPGVVVAATSSESHRAAFEFSATSPPIATPVQTAPYAPIGTAIPPPLAPGVLAIREAFARHGTFLEVRPWGTDGIELVEPHPAGDCPTTVILFDERDAMHMYMNSCHTGSFRYGDVLVDYSPPSVGPIVDETVARLPG